MREQFLLDLGVGRHPDLPVATPVLAANEIFGLFKLNFEDFIVREPILRKHINFSKSTLGFNLDKRKKMFFL